MWQVIFIVISAFVLQYIAAHMLISKPDIQVAYHVTTDRDCESDEHKFQMMFGQTLPDCVIECALREHCAVMNYQAAMTLCELYKKEGKMVPNTSHSCKSVLKNNIRLIKSPCNDSKTCPSGKACDILSKTCLFKECLDAPSVENGHVLGNRKDVGSMIRFKCNRWYKLSEDSSATAVCDNGQWSYSGHCVPGITLGERCPSSVSDVLCSDSNAECTNTDSGYKCQCKSGYYDYDDDKSTTNVGGKCEQTGVVGNMCNGTECLDVNARCAVFWKGSTETKQYCHCKFGFEFNETVGACIKDCNQYSNDSSIFIKQANLRLPNYSLNIQKQQPNVSACVNYCSKTCPEFLSINFMVVSNFGQCVCKTISERQYIKAHGSLASSGTSNKHFFDRPCASKQAP